MTPKVTFRPLAEADLLELYDYIAGEENPVRAIHYLERIEKACRQIADFPERGLARPDLLPGLRVVGFERRVSIAFLVESDAIRIVRILYGGRLFPDEWEA